MKQQYRKRHPLALSLPFLLVTFAAVHSADLHVCISGDTLEASIGESVKIDVSNIRAEAQEIASACNMNLRLTILEGKKDTAAAILGWVSGLNVRKDDAVIYYNSSHGFRTSEKNSKWPFIYSADKKGVDLYEVFGLLKAKKPRFLFAMSDSCNNVLPSGAIETVSTRGDARYAEEAYRKLFLQFHGYIIASSSIPGQYSLGAGEVGGLFTYGLLTSLHAELEKGTKADWQNIFENAEENTLKFTRNKQKPQYELDGSTLAAAVSSVSRNDQNLARQDDMNAINAALSSRVSQNAASGGEIPVGAWTNGGYAYRFSADGGLAISAVKADKNRKGGFKLMDYAQGSWKKEGSGLSWSAALKTGGKVSQAFKKCEEGGGTLLLYRNKTDIKPTLVLVRAALP